LPKLKRKSPLFLKERCPYGAEIARIRVSFCLKDALIAVVLVKIMTNIKFGER